MVDLGADALENVGGAVDHGVEQVHQHRFAGGALRAGAHQLVADDHERTRLVVAHRDQAVAREDERHRRGLGGVGIGLAHQRGRHVPGVVLDVEPAGDLDLLHLLARRDGDAEMALEQLVFRQGRQDEVEPDRGFRDVAIRRDRDALERRTIWNVG